MLLFEAYDTLHLVHTEEKQMRSEASSIGIDCFIFVIFVDNPKMIAIKSFAFKP